MKKLKLKLIGWLIIALCVCVNVSAQNTGKGTDKNKYQKIEVVKFDIKESVEKFTDESLNVMMAEIVNELKKLNKFKEVAMERANTENGQTEATAEETTLRLVGTVTEFKEGNRAARYLIGFGAGRAKVKARIKILDSAGTVLLERDVDGNVVMGAFGGSGSAVTRGLAKEIGKVVNRRFF